MNSNGLRINPGWSLFLDRDGVLNERIIDGYVTSWNDFHFLPGVPEALNLLKRFYEKIIIVSNQQGIGKGFMTENDLREIHDRMKHEIEKAGGRIDAIYHSPYLEQENSILRKPNVGMALKARKEFPGINFKRSIMVGDSLSDMLFGKRLKMKTVLLSQDISLIRSGSDIIDLVYDDLISFASDLSIIPQSLSPSIPQSLSPSVPHSLPSPPLPAKN